MYEEDRKKIVVVRQVITRTIYPTLAKSPGRVGVDGSGVIAIIVMLAMAVFFYVLGINFFLGQHPIIGYLLMMAVNFIPFAFFCDQYFRVRLWVAILILLALPLVELAVVDFFTRVYAVLQ